MSMPISSRPGRVNIRSPICEVLFDSVLYQNVIFLVSFCFQRLQVSRGLP